MWPLKFLSTATVICAICRIIVPGAAAAADTAGEGPEPRPPPQLPSKVTRTRTTATTEDEAPEIFPTEKSGFHNNVPIYPYTSLITHNDTCFLKILEKIVENSVLHHNLEKNQSGIIVSRIRRHYTNLTKNISDTLTVLMNNLLEFHRLIEMTNIAVRPDFPQPVKDVKVEKVMDEEGLPWIFYTAASVFVLAVLAYFVFYNRAKLFRSETANGRQILQDVYFDANTAEP